MSPLCLSFHDVNEAFTEVMGIRKHFAQIEQTRNGEAYVFPGPVMLVHTAPHHRVLFDPVRNANPFFHYMEAIWMLSGSDSVQFPSQFAANLRNYSDDGKTFHGAYGWRWSGHYGFDQIAECVDILKKDPASRRAVIAMWDPEMDLGADSKDLPCNTHLYLQIKDELLHMTVCNRSNDLVWGMLGANIVHFSILHEYIAGALGKSMGSLCQFTNNLHVYKGFEDKFSPSADRWYRAHPRFASWRFTPDNLYLAEAERFVWEGNDTDEPYRSRIISRNAQPMLHAWNAHKEGDSQRAIGYALSIYDEDWRKACTEWLGRKNGEV